MTDTEASKTFTYLMTEPCPNCGLDPGEEGHAALEAEIVTKDGEQVFMLCDKCAEGLIRGDASYNEARILSSLEKRYLSR